MDDFVIYDNARILAREQPEHRARMEDKTRQFNSALLQFFREAELLTAPSRWDVFTDWANFSFRKSDLTEDGFELVRQCHDKWLAKTDRTGKVDMVMWEKALAKLRGNT